MKPWRSPKVRKINLKRSSSASRKNARSCTRTCLCWRPVLQRKSQAVRSYKLRLIESWLSNVSFDSIVLVSVWLSFQTSEIQTADDELKSVIKILLSRRWLINQSLSTDSNYIAIAILRGLRCLIFMLICNFSLLYKFEMHTRSVTHTLQCCCYRFCLISFI